MGRPGLLCSDPLPGDLLTRFPPASAALAISNWCQFFFAFVFAIDFSLPTLAFPPRPPRTSKQSMSLFVFVVFAFFVNVFFAFVFLPLYFVFEFFVFVFIIDFGRLWLCRLGKQISPAAHLLN